MGKMLLPHFGGGPAVWNTCMVFYQVGLLVGYIYADQASRWMDIRSQSIIHIGLLLSAFAFIPVVSSDVMPETLANPTFTVLYILMTTIGVPFILLSATSPLLQRWLVFTDVPDADDPYYLYAASNTGSLIALLVYPFFVERYLEIPRQTHLWVDGYTVFAFLMVAATGLLWMRFKPVKTEATPEKTESDSRNLSDSGLEWTTRFGWLWYAFVPSSLMLGVTTHITIDLAPAPLLWVIPLAIYLGSFAVVFSRTLAFDSSYLRPLVPFLTLILCWLHLDNFSASASFLIGTHLVFLSLFALFFHGELARSRPSSEFLTEFYIWLSLGGALGGIFNGIVAPVIFDGFVEYVGVAVAAALFLPARRRFEEWTLMAVLCSLGVILVFVFAWLHAGDTVFLYFFTAITCSLVYATLRGGRLRNIVVAALGALVLFSVVSNKSTVFEGRSFFSTYKVLAGENPDRHYLYHGNTLHGLQVRSEGLTRMGFPYYTKYSPVADVLNIFEPKAGPARKTEIGVVGLGTGAMASLLGRNEKMQFYELDPIIADIARNEQYFSFLHRADGDVDVEIGDGRMKLEEDRDDRFDVIAIDAFSSDSIPRHLLTREALRMYDQKLREGGIVVIHTSNRYLNLSKLVAATASSLNFSHRLKKGPDLDREVDGRPIPPFVASSEWIAVARDSHTLSPLELEHDWRKADSYKKIRPWTDDYSTLLDIYRVF